MTTLRRFAKKGLKALGYAVFLLLSVWALLELAFRYQWIDFYAVELRGLNPAAALEADTARKTVLVLGDSFSAQPQSYVGALRDSLPELRIVNASVPGTGIREAALIAQNRFRRFPPDILVYQVYTGNDLWDIRKTAGSPRIAPARNLYWRLSDYSLFLRYLNYKLGQFKGRTGMATETRELKQDIPFSPALYSRREQLILRAEPDLLQNSVLAQGRRSADLGFWLEKTERLLSRLPARTRRVLILVVPHCAQLNDFYAGHLTALGAAPFGPETRQADYPFLRQIEQRFAHDPRVRVVSPLPLFQQADSSGSRLYYENDPHLSPAGHVLLAKALQGSLQGHDSKTNSAASGQFPVN